MGGLNPRLLLSVLTSQAFATPRPGGVTVMIHECFGHTGV